MVGMDRGHTVLGVMEAAELLDVDQRTPHTWRRRGLFPDPDHESVNGEPAWNRVTVISWAARTGRLPASLAVEGLDSVDGALLPTRRGGAKMKRKLAREKEQANAD
jgi:hypothetical protein